MWKSLVVYCCVGNTGLTSPTGHVWGLVFFWIWLCKVESSDFLGWLEICFSIIPAFCFRLPSRAAHQKTFLSLNIFNSKYKRPSKHGIQLNWEWGPKSSDHIVNNIPHRYIAFTAPHSQNVNAASLSPWLWVSQWCPWSRVHCTDTQLLLISRKNGIVLRDVLTLETLSLGRAARWSTAVLNTSCPPGTGLECSGEGEFWFCKSSSYCQSPKKEMNRRCSTF